MCLIVLQFFVFELFNVFATMKNNKDRNNTMTITAGKHICYDSDRCAEGVQKNVCYALKITLGGNPPRGLVRFHTITYLDV